MYIPEPFRETRPEILAALLRQHDFGCLITHSAAEGLEATHLPLLYAQDGDAAVLRGHMARANPQWRRFDGQQPALAVFSGPHGYISPSWYEADFAVPTWNYVAVHVTGVPRVVEDPQAVRTLLDDLVAAHERDGWTVSWADERYERMLAAIVAFEMPVDSIQGKAKLNQNRPQADQRGAIDGLAATGRAADRELADYMRRDLGLATAPA